MTPQPRYGSRALWVRDFASIGAISALLAPLCAVFGIRLLFGYDVGAPLLYFGVAMVAAIPTGAAVGLALHKLVQNTHRAVLLPIVPLVGALWGASVGAIAGYMLETELFFLSAGCGALAGAAQVGWLWIPYTSRAGRKSTTPLIWAASYIACALGLAAYVGWAFVDSFTGSFS